MIPAHKKILIVGDAGRGKTTFAQKLSAKTGIPLYSLDDFFWKKKFTEKNNTEEAIGKATEIYNKDTWIVEGTTRHLIQPGLPHADLILNFGFKTILEQYFFLFKRHLHREEETFFEFLSMAKHVLFKKLSLGYMKGSPTRDQLLKPHTQKVISFHSFKEINRYLEQL